ncbi:hypothetical protein [Demequina salsinemoris]|uniref:hypothetical protein n=1 Tax=Demequina salsinemoris TaxID=577470 RepID=UPI000782F92D|nr:hypothetical protein [Demequina salsinemoris]
MRWLAAVAVTGAALAGCAQTIDDPPPTGDASDGISLDGRGDHGVPGDVLEADEDVSYYPACGNEVLRRDGVAWYPFTPTNLDAFPDDPLAVTASTESSAVVLPAVVAPGPGDDTGTLVIYVGELAYWESDSGDLATWLTMDEIQYAWEC